MSVGEAEPQSFFGPLMGKTTTFLLEGKQANLAFAAALGNLLAETRVPCAILDLDAFYASNSERILSSMDAPTAKSTLIRVPEPGSDVEVDLSRLFGLEQKVIIIDSLNTLYHLISLEDGSSRGRKLTFTVESLSYFARTSGRAVVLSMYRREGFYRAGTGRSISGLSDVTASVDFWDGGLRVKTERGRAWPGGAFSTRIP